MFVPLLQERSLYFSHRVFAFPRTLLRVQASVCAILTNVTNPVPASKFAVRNKICSAYLLARNIRYEEDLVDQLFNSSEKRLARILLFACSFRQGRRARDGNPQDQPGDPCRDDRHDPVAGQFFYESVQKVGFS